MKILINFNLISNIPVIGDKTKTLVILMGAIRIRIRITNDRIIKSSTEDTTMLAHKIVRRATTGQEGLPKEFLVLYLFHCKTRSNIIIFDTDGVRRRLLYRLFFLRIFSCPVGLSFVYVSFFTTVGFSWQLELITGH